MVLGAIADTPSRADDQAPPKLPQDGQNRIVAPWTTKGMTINCVAICFDPAL